MQSGEYIKYLECGRGNRELQMKFTIEIKGNKIDMNDPEKALKDSIQRWSKRIQEQTAQSNPLSIFYRHATRK